ncbi:uncharacterized mitochondrial protein-like protein [Tanacetum coccineum]
MTKTTNEQGFISAVYEGKTHEDLHTCLFAYFLSQVEPKKVIQSLTDPSWIEPMNKKDERVAWIEAIRLFLAYASFKDFVVYQMDVKSAFLYSKIEEEVYVCQPLGFEDLEFPDRVMQKEDGIFISQDKYVDEILKKFGFSTMRIASTPMETSKPLVKDAEAEDVDVYLYRLMIGSLIYLTASRPDIMFAVCACARFQVTPKVSHLHAMKRIFRYLKGQPKLGLWYPMDSPFNLETYSDRDYAGASLDRKSTIGGCQFLRSRLISCAAREKVNVVGLKIVDFLNVGPISLRGDSVERVATITTSLDAQQGSGNINRTQSTTTLNQPIPQGTSSGSGPRCQDTIGDRSAQTRFDRLSKQSNKLPLLRVYTLGIGEDSMKLQELMDLYTKLSNRVLDLENVKDAQALEIQKLKKRVKKLESKKKTM